jgi:multimeric flavodoxin WrbA
MNALILHGGSPGGPDLEAIHDALADAWRAAGWTVETLRLADMKIGPCVGCFNCWLKTPGVCTQDDDGRTVTRAIVQSDATVYLTPVTFGGYSSTLKYALDRMIPSVSPLFEKHHGEMHHVRRYPYEHNLLVVGWQAAPDEAGAALFTRLVARNAYNMRPPVWGSLVLDGTQAAETQRAQLAAQVARLTA